MKIIFKNFYLFSVPVDFDLSWLKILSSNHLIVILGFNEKIGIGEGVLYHSPLPRTVSLLVKQVKHFFNQDFDSFKQAREKLIETFPDNLDLVCAFDLALWDLEGKVNAKSLGSLLNKAKRERIILAEQIFIPKNKINLISEVKNILKRGTKIIKLKAGRNLKLDLNNILLIQQISEEKVAIQLDLNQGLKFEQALWFGKKIRKMGITAWEEPIAFTDFSQLRILRRMTKIPIILDESIKTIVDLDKAINNQALDILNIKLSRLGGLTNSLKLINLAKRNRIKIDIGCSEELGIGLSGQWHLGCSLANLRLVEGIGSWRLGFDLINEEIKVRDGLLRLAIKKRGLGVNFNLQKLYHASKRLHFPIVNKKNCDYSFIFYLNYFTLLSKNKFYNGLLFLRKSANQL